MDSRGRHWHREVATASFPLDARQVPTPPSRVDVVRARVLHDLSFGAQVRVSQDTVAELMVRPVGEEARVLVVDVPHVHQRGFIRMHELPNGWELLGFELEDGTPLRATHAPLSGDQQEGRGDRRTFLVELPRALPVGEAMVVRVRYRDHHRYSRYYESEASPVPGGPFVYQVESLGVGVDFQALPTLRSHGGASWPATVRVAVPAHLPRHQVAVTGDPGRSWQEAQRRFTEVETRHGEVARVAVGRWTRHADPPAAGLPAVTAALQAGRASEAKRVSALIRQAVVFHTSLLHPLELDQLTVAELGSTGASAVASSWGDQLLTFSPSFQEAWRHKPLRLRSAYAMVRGVHAQWWLESGAPSVEPSLPAHVGAAYALLFMSRTARRVDYQELRELARALVDRGHFAAMSRQAPVEVGAFVLGYSLREEVGEQAFFGGVHAVVSGRAPPTWEGLRLALEEATGRDLSGWFDVWIHGDHAPSIQVSWERRDRDLHLSLTTDVPFGGFTVPVQVNGEVHRIPVVDGSGAWILGDPKGRRPRIAVDPDETLLLGGVRVSRGE